MFWTEKLILFAVALQTIEWFQVRSLMADDGIWRQGLRRQIAMWTGNASSLLITRLVILALAAVRPEAPLFLFLFASQLLLLVRFQGAYNGGSDAVTTLALGILWMDHSFPAAPLVHQACLLYLGLQIVLSYFISGIGKLPNAQWRQGSALFYFLTSGKYQVPEFWQKLASKKSPFLKVSAYAVLAFELAFPLVVLHPTLCWIGMGFGLVFHWFNYQIFGLNRFFWIWLACYPALLETSVWISEKL